MARVLKKDNGDGIEQVRFAKPRKPAFVAGLFETVDTTVLVRAAEAACMLPVDSVERKRVIEEAIEFVRRRNPEMFR